MRTKAVDLASGLKALKLQALKLQSSKAPKLQSFKASKLQSFKASKLQSFKASKLQSLKQHQKLPPLKRRVTFFCPKPQKKVTKEKGVPVSNQEPASAAHTRG
ncbi:hypothetical protein [Lysobacter capsici]|uniref:hypothetical protein n=1 Tax=Lysobacter capsici TaxID=435897 RepID=UPI0012FE6843|nr:hypothetical protein [Lysobacter capsici]